MQIVIRHTIAMLLLICGLSATGQSLKLFSPEQRQATGKLQLVVMDFMERYFRVLQSQNQTTIQTKMADDKVFFRQGSLSDLSHVADTMPLSINLVDRHYEVTWQKDSLPFLTVVFPAQYDLLLGMQKDEAVKTLKEMVLRSPQRDTPVTTPSNLTLVTDSLYQTQGDIMELASLTDALYFIKERDEYMPVFDNTHPDYSAANLFHGLISNKDYRMYVEQSVYGMKTINYSLSLRQWLNYCDEWGLKVFFAVEEQRKDGLLALIIAQSKELGFNHMLSVIIPDKFITDQNAVLKVQMTPYIPIHNIKNIYQEEYAKHRKIKWQ